MSNNQVTQKGSTTTHYGKIGWALVFTSAICYMFSGSFWNTIAPNVIVPQVAQVLGFETTSPVLYANTIIALLSIVMSFIMSWLHEKFSNRIIMLCEYIIMGAGLFAVGRVTSLPMYVICWLFVVSMGYNIGNVALPRLVGNYMPTKKASALGWATVGTVGANLVLLPWLNSMCSNQGFMHACTVFAVIEVVLGILNFLAWTDDPAKRNYVPDNGDTPEEELEHLTARNGAVSNWTAKEILTNKNFWLLGFGYGVCFMVQQIIGSQLVVYEVSNGIPQATAVRIMSIVAVVGMVSSAVSGYVDQKLGTKKATFLMLLSYAISLAAAGFLPFSTVSNAIFIVFYCLVLGAISNLPASHAINVYGPDFAKAWKFILIIILGMSSCSSLILGKVMELTGSYKGAFVYGVFIAIAGIIIISFSDSKVIKKPGEKPVAVKISNK